MGLVWRVWGTAGRREACDGRDRVVRRDSAAVDIFAAAGAVLSWVLFRAPLVLVAAADFDVIAAGWDLLHFFTGTKLNDFDSTLWGFLAYLFNAEAR